MSAIVKSEPHSHGPFDLRLSSTISRVENKSLDASHNVLLKLNGEEVLNVDVLPRMYLTRSVCPNHEKNGILQFYVNNELKNTFIISETYNLGVWTE